MSRDTRYGEDSTSDMTISRSFTREQDERTAGSGE